MSFIFPDYIKQVKAEFLEKQEQNTLSLLLREPTPAAIRKECENVFKERFRKKDIPALRMFFGPGDSEKEFLQLISAFPTDKFKPLVNYLKGETDKTDKKNIELLAWLIDFSDRPYVVGKNQTVSKTNSTLAEERFFENKGGAQFSDPTTNPIDPISLREADGENQIIMPARFTETTSTAVPNTSYKFWVKTLAFSGLMMVLFAWAFFANRKDTRQYLDPTGECMYWNNDHYEITNCANNNGGKLLLPLDMKRVENFQRITLEDTITEKSINKVFYIKLDGKIEYYTAGGMHPIYVNKRLKPLSRYMFDKYLRNKDSIK